MKILYSDDKTQKQCSNLKEALKLFGGDKRLAISLLTRINALEQAEVLKDIIMTPTFRFHNLKGNWKGFFAIDVKTIKDKWRIILLPLDERENKYNPCNIDEIATSVRIVEIQEVSPHYE